MIKIDGKIYSEMPKSDKFAMATNVWLDNLPQVTALPDMPMATDVCLDKNLSKL